MITPVQVNFTIEKQTLFRLIECLKMAEDDTRECLNAHLVRSNSETVKGARITKMFEDQISQINEFEKFFTDQS